MITLDTPLIKMENIHKWFGNVYALKGIDFTVNKEEVVGLVGDNGAGKSTLIKIISGILQPDRGKIFINGEKVKFNSSRDAINQGIETLYQERAIIKNLSIMRNMFLGREITNSLGLLKMNKMNAEVNKALEKIGLNLRTPSGLANNLSGGQSQGVAIARSLYFKTKILIMDEPTNSMSVKESRKILNKLIDLKFEGISSIFITHKVCDVYEVSDRIVVLRNGEKIAEFDKNDTSNKEVTKLLSD